MRRARPGERTLLTPKEPVVTLDRLQSGVGALTFDAVVSAAVGDVRLGCAYDLADGHTSTVQRAGGSAAAPRDSRRPVIVAGNGDGRSGGTERLVLDLRQNRTLRRLVVYGFSETGRPVQWGGTLVVSALAGTRIELPLDLPESGGVAVFMSVYNVHGEFVIRGEMEVVNGSVRDACTAYGFNRITWIDGHRALA